MFSRQLNGWERGQTLSPRTRDRADVPPSALRLPVVCCCLAPTEWLPLSHWGLLFVRHLSRDPRSTTVTMPSCVSFSHLTFLIKIKHQHSPTCYHLNDILDDVSTVCSRSSWTRDTNWLFSWLLFQLVQADVWSCWLTNELVPIFRVHFSFNNPVDIIASSAMFWTTYMLYLYICLTEAKWTHILLTNKIKTYMNLELFTIIIYILLHGNYFVYL